MPWINTQHFDFARGAFAKAFQDLDRCGLASPVRSQQGEVLTGFNVEIDAAHSRYVAVVLLEPSHPNGSPLHRPSSPRGQALGASGGDSALVARP